MIWRENRRNVRVHTSSDSNCNFTENFTASPVLRRIRKRKVLKNEKSDEHQIGKKIRIDHLFEEKVLSGTKFKLEPKHVFHDLSNKQATINTIQKTNVNIHKICQKIYNIPQVIPTRTY